MLVRPRFSRQSVSPWRMLLPIWTRWLCPFARIVLVGWWYLRRGGGTGGGGRGEVSLTLSVTRGRLGRRAPSGLKPARRSAPRPALRKPQSPSPSLAGRGEPEGRETQDGQDGADRDAAGAERQLCHVERGLEVGVVLLDELGRERRDDGGGGGHGGRAEGWGGVEGALRREGGREGRRAGLKDDAAGWPAGRVGVGARPAGSAAALREPRVAFWAGRGLSGTARLASAGWEGEGGQRASSQPVSLSLRRLSLSRSSVRWQHTPSVPTACLSLCLPACPPTSAARLTCLPALAFASPPPPARNPRSLPSPDRPKHPGPSRAAAPHPSTLPPPPRNPRPPPSAGPVPAATHPARRCLPTSRASPRSPLARRPSPSSSRARAHAARAVRLCPASWRLERRRRRRPVELWRRRSRPARANPAGPARRPARDGPQGV